MGSSIKYNIPITSSGSSAYVDTNYILSGASSPFISDAYSTNNIYSYKSNVDLIGQGTVHLISGSTNISGISTNFLDATTGTGLSYWFQMWVKDSSNNMYLIFLNTITDNTHATIFNHYNRGDLRLNKSTSRGSTWKGVTGTYTYWITRNWSDGIYSIAMGNNSYSGDFATAIGGATAYGSGSFAAGSGKIFNNATNSFAAGSVSVTGSSSAAFGNNTGVYGAGSFGAGDSNLVAFGSSFGTVFGSRTKVSGSGAFAGGIGLSTKEVLASGTAAFNYSNNNSSQTAGHGAQAQGSAILGGLNHNISTGATRSVVIGGNAIKVTTGTTDTVFMPKVRIGQGTGGSLTTNNTNANLLARNSTTGDIEISTAGFLTSTETGSVNSVKANMDVLGQGTVTLTSGSTGVVGNGTNFQTATTGLGFSYWLEILVVDSSNNLFRLSIGSVASNTSATISVCYNENDIGNASLTNRGANYVGVSGTYSYYIVKNYSKDLYSFTVGTNAYAKNFGIAMGGSISATGQTSLALGRFTQAGGSQAVAMGSIARAGGAQSFAGGLGSTTGGDKKLLANGVQSFIYSTNNSSQTVGHGALAGQSVILGGLNSNIPSNSTRSVIIGGNTIKATSATTDTVFIPKVRVGQGTGAGLTSGATSTNFVVRATDGTGELQIRAINRVISGATNGVTVLSNSKVQLGGQLTGSTQIGLTANILTFTASTGSIKYGGNYSANFSARSLVDKGYVTGLTTTSAINQVVYGSANGQLSSTSNLLWSGSTNMVLTGNFKLGTAGNGFYVKEGSNATMGVKTLTGGTAVVSTTKVTATSRIQLTSQSDGGTPGFVRVSARSAGTSFTITSSSGSDTSVIGWIIFEPA